MPYAFQQRIGNRNVVNVTWIKKDIKHSIQIYYYILIASPHLIHQFPFTAMTCRAFERAEVLLQIIVKHRMRVTTKKYMLGILS